MCFSPPSLGSWPCFFPPRTGETPPGIGTLARVRGLASRSCSAGAPTCERGGDLKPRVERTLLGQLESEPWPNFCEPSSKGNMKEIQRGKQVVQGNHTDSLWGCLLLRAILSTCVGVATLKKHPGVVALSFFLRLKLSETECHVESQNFGWQSSTCNGLLVRYNSRGTFPGHHQNPTKKHSPFVKRTMVEKNGEPTLRTTIVFFRAAEKNPRGSRFEQPPKFFFQFKDRHSYQPEVKRCWMQHESFGFSGLSFPNKTNCWQGIIGSRHTPRENRFVIEKWLTGMKNQPVTASSSRFNGISHVLPRFEPKALCWSLVQEGN